MTIYAVGQPHPLWASQPALRQYVALAPQLQVEIGEGGLEVHCYLDSPNPKEIKAFESLPVHFAFRDLKGLLLGWMQIDETFQFEFTYNAMPLMALSGSEREELLRLPAGVFLGAPLILTDSATGVVKALRFGTLNSHSAQFVMNNIRTQLAQGPMGPAMAQSVISQFMRDYPSFKAARATAAVHTRLGAKSG